MEKKIRDKILSTLQDIEIWIKEDGLIDGVYFDKKSVLVKIKKAIKLFHRKPKLSKAIIEVLGGVAYVKKCPDNVVVEIIDHDNKEE